MKTNKVSVEKGNSVVAGITGAMIGAGVAVAATVAMSDKKTRTKVMKTLNSVKEEVKRKVGSEIEEARMKTKRIDVKKKA